MVFHVLVSNAVHRISAETRLANRNAGHGLDTVDVSRICLRRFRSSPASAAAPDARTVTTDTPRHRWKLRMTTATPPRRLTKNRRVPVIDSAEGPTRFSLLHPIHEAEKLNARLIRPQIARRIDRNSFAVKTISRNAP